ncbi:HAD-IA family hydrolase [Thiomicrospira microaerophila]|uniref:HAD family hydrolase n=1 Tax=Thiomicrospira microaerophila TaxID=406020 RepID=UPI00200E0595|nr:HAD-IA family hydrolase [Thiomicrospira microaerophila]UQB43097.1 HAD-IA family hydrolase [Thiomicrospira microaerophila]
MSLDCVLFDLDGTLLDTSYDFSYALNLLCDEYRIAAPSYNQVRNTVSQGGAAVTRLAFPDNDDSDFEDKRRRFLNIYKQNIALHTQLFPGLQAGLVYLAENKIPWGIVTNKPTELTEHLLAHFNFPTPPRTVVCGDTLAVRKPHPEPMWLAAEECGVAPESCLYLGDHPRDLEAGINAGMKTGAALFGYMAPEKFENLMQADFLFRTPYDITQFIKERMS